MGGALVLAVSQGGWVAIEMVGVLLGAWIGWASRPGDGRKDSHWSRYESPFASYCGDHSLDDHSYVATYRRRWYAPWKVDRYVRCWDCDVRLVARKLETRWEHPEDRT